MKMLFQVVCAGVCPCRQKSDFLSIYPVSGTAHDVDFIIIANKLTVKLTKQNSGRLFEIIVKDRATKIRKGMNIMGQTTYEKLYDYSGSLTEIMNTHSHFIPNYAGDAITLHQILQMTYISWISPVFPDTYEGRKAYIEKMSSNSYFRWMAKSVGELYGSGIPLTLENWDLIDANLRSAYLDKDNSVNILKNKCLYKAIILDKYENPGFDDSLPEIMTPTFRCDQFLCGYFIDGHDENKNYPYRTLGLAKCPGTIKEYVTAVSSKIAEMKKRGCVSIKIAIAYERDIFFEKTDLAQADIAFNNPDAKPLDIRAFGNFMMYRLCKIAAVNDMPVQIHTGLGKLERSNAIGLWQLIHNNPGTKFVLFHCGYPWMDDILGLLHNYKNVYPDLCWLPLISTSAAVRFLKEALEVGDSGRFCWGCDTWTAEESFGALLAVRHVLAKALSEMCEEDAITFEMATHLIYSILCTNAKNIYNIK